MLILPYNISKEEVEKCAEISRDLDKPIFIEPGLYMILKVRRNI